MEKLNDIKYAFVSEHQYLDTLKLIEVSDEKGNISYPDVLGKFELGHYVVEPQKLDKNDKVYRKAVLSKHYCVDIAWVNEENEAFRGFASPCMDNGKHKFSGHNYMD